MPVVESSKPNTSILQPVIMCILACTTSLIAVGVYTGKLEQRVVALEENRPEINKRLDRIEEKTVDKKTYDADQMKTRDTLSEIKSDVKDLRNVMMTPRGK